MILVDRREGEGTPATDRLGLLEALLELLLALESFRHFLFLGGLVSIELVVALHEVGSSLCGIKFHGAFALNRRVDLHAIDATSARRRGGAGSSAARPLERARTAASSPRAPDALVDFHTGASLLEGSHFLFFSFHIVGLLR